jgi:hypothetical protein
VNLCHWIKAHPELLSVILFTDEASFTRDGINNSRNLHTWSDENPQRTRITNFQRRFSVNARCGLLGDKLIGPFVFDNNLTGDTYEFFLRNELPGLLEDIPLVVRSQLYFQHDGAPPHYTRHVREYLDESFPNRWFGRGGPLAWPPRSPDLTSWLLSLGTHEGISVRNEGWFKSSAWPSYFCSGRAHTQPSTQHCVSYTVSIDACCQMLSNQRRTFWTPVRQVF